MKRKFSFLLAVILFVFSHNVVFAESSYVLPYPSAMPGSLWYKLNLLQEKFDRFWYFGNFSQFQYNLSLANKYLVESKTLFEYKQYLLAYKSLEKSNGYFRNAPIFLDRAQNEGKNISEKKELLKSAAEKHVEVLKKIKAELPESFIWQPEKEKETKLELHKLLNYSQSVRLDCL